MEATPNSEPREQGTAGLELCLFGAAPDTGNMGVSALCLSTVAAIIERDPGARFTILDHGHGIRREQLHLPGGAVEVTMCGASHSRRFYRSDTLWNAWARSWFGGLGSPILERIRASDAVLDISAGDSFADLYGPRRFNAETLPKRLALGQDVPLVLLPQTYGPFQGRKPREQAAQLVRAARMAWARDQDSFEVLKDLLGEDFDPARHRLGVDLAFGLPATPPRQEFLDPIAGWLADAEPVIGINVSGLIYNQERVARSQFGLRASYRDVVHRLLEAVLSTGSRVILVPHVLAPSGNPESDLDACLALQGEFRRHKDSLAVVEQELDACSTKWLIGRMEWFCGTRMHSTIAALSQGVPTAAIAYSMKTRGVFASCGQEESVADPRHLDTEATLDRILQAWQDRSHRRSILAARLPEVMRQQAEQMDAILQVCRQRVR